MDIEYHPSCAYDAVDIYSSFPAAPSNGGSPAATTADGGLDAPLPPVPDQTFCGSEVPGSVTLDADAVVEFRSDHIVPKPGFSATVVFIRPSGRPKPVKRLFVSNLHI